VRALCKTTTVNVVISAVRVCMKISSRSMRFKGCYRNPMTHVSPLACKNNPHTLISTQTDPVLLSRVAASVEQRCSNLLSRQTSGTSLCDCFHDVKKFQPLSFP